MKSRNIDVIQRYILAFVRSSVFRVLYRWRLAKCNARYNDIHECWYWITFDVKRARAQHNKVAKHAIFCSNQWKYVSALINQQHAENHNLPHLDENSGSHQPNNKSQKTH